MADGPVRGHPRRGRVQGDQPGGGLRAQRDGMRRRVGHLDPAVDGDVAVAADGHRVAEVGDGHPGAIPAEARDQGGQVAVSVGPGGRRVVVDAVAVGRALDRCGGAAARPVARGHEEAAAQARRHRLAVAGPADHPGVAESAVDGLAARWPVRRAAVRRGRGCRCRRARRARGGDGRSPGRGQGCAHHDDHHSVQRPVRAAGPVCATDRGDLHHGPFRQTARGSCAARQLPGRPGSNRPRTPACPAAARAPRDRRCAVRPGRGQGSSWLSRPGTSPGPLTVMSAMLSNSPGTSAELTATHSDRSCPAAASSPAA